MGRSAELDYDGIAALYDISRIDTKPYIDFYSQLLQPHMTRIMDMGCGTGTITRELASRLRQLGTSDQIDVIGLDLSQAMLNVARQHDPSIAWIKGDMTTIPDIGPIDLVVCCYNSLQHLNPDALESTFRSVRTVLANTGRFGFDMYRPNFEYIRKSRRNDLTRLIVTPDGARLEVREDSTFDETKAMLLITWRIVLEGGTSDEVLASAEYRLWQHKPEAVEAALCAAGLRIAERYGDLDRQPWSHNARKQVIVCDAV